MIDFSAPGRRRPQLAGAHGDITGPRRGSRGPPPPVPLLLLPLPSERRVRPQQARGALRGGAGHWRAGPAAAAAAAAGEPAAAAQGVPSDATDAPANLGARSRYGARSRSDEDGRALDAVLLQQLLPVLPCPHRHHPARRLVPGERGDDARGAHLPGRPSPHPGPWPQARAPSTPPPPSPLRQVWLRCLATPALICLKLYY